MRIELNLNLFIKIQSKKYEKRIVSNLKKCVMKNLKELWNERLKKWNEILKEYARASSYAIHR